MKWKKEKREIEDYRIVKKIHPSPTDLGFCGFANLHIFLLVKIFKMSLPTKNTYFQNRCLYSRFTCNVKLVHRSRNVRCMLTVHWVYIVCSLFINCSVHSHCSSSVHCVFLGKWAFSTCSLFIERLVHDHCSLSVHDQCVFVVHWAVSSCSLLLNVQCECSGRSVRVRCSLNS